MSASSRESDQARDSYQARLLWVGVTAFGERWAADASDESTWRLSFRDQGEAVLRYRDQSVPMPTCQPVLIAPLAARGAKPEGDASHLLIEFRLAAGEAPIRAVNERPLALAPDELRDRLFGRLLRDLSAPGRSSSATLARAEAALHLSLASGFETEASGSGGDERQLHTVLRYIDAHLNEPLDNTRLAALAHASESHFIRSFRRLLGRTPARHVQERRVERGAELLAHTTLSIDEIAERCGFANRYHFSRVFAQRMALPPARYRAAKSSRSGPLAP